MRSSRISLLLFLGLLTGAPTVASAHGRFPELTGLDTGPGADGRLLGVATFGLLLEDSAGHFEFLCREVIGASLTEDPVVTRMGDGSLVAATFSGLLRSTDGGCTWETPSGAPARGVFIDVVRDLTDPMAALAVTSAGGEDNTLYRTLDGGATWAPTGDAIGPVLFERVRSAPSEPSRVYLSGATVATGTTPRELWIYRSDDGGVTFAPTLLTGHGGARNLQLLAVSPTDPDELWARVVRDPDVPGTSDALIVSRDGGATFETVATVANVGGFALSADGGTIWFGARPDDEPGHEPAGDERGLWRSDDGGRTLVALDATLSVHCLSARAGALHACADDSTNAFAIGRSSGDANFTPLLRLAELAGPLSCPAGTPGATMCEDAWTDAQADLNIHGPSGSGGCAVATAAHADAPTTPTACLALVGAWLCTRRRGRGRS